MDSIDNWLGRLNPLKPAKQQRSQASGSNSAVECQLPKLDVAGSSPVSRSIFSVTWGILSVSTLMRLLL